MTSDPKPLPCPPTSLTAEELENEQEKVRDQDTEDTCDHA